MNDVKFQIKVYSRTFLHLVITSDGTTEELWFKFSSAPNLDGDTLSIALSTLCGTKFSNIYFEWEVSEIARKKISEWTGADVRSKGSSGNHHLAPQLSDSSVLNFSGGLDSLACLACLGEAVELVSLDFGGRFSREMNFFQQFNTKIISTNLTKTSLRKNSWSFMGLGALLYRNVLKGKYLTFGSVLEAGSLRLSSPQTRTSTFPPFKIAKYQNANSVAGVSEAGTIAIVRKFFPKQLAGSLKSVASPGEEKFYRKNALAEIVGSELGFSFPPTRTSKRHRIHYQFGENFAVDLTALYFLSRDRGDLAKKLINSVPPELDSITSDLSFDFMLKADQNYYSTYPSCLRPQLDRTFEEAGLSWYSKGDYEEVNALKSILSPIVTYSLG